MSKVKDKKAVEKNLLLRIIQSAGVDGAAYPPASGGAPQRFLISTVASRGQLVEHGGCATLFPQPLPVSATEA
jgi:hypothetical protein